MTIVWQSLKSTDQFCNFKWEIIIPLLWRSCGETRPFITSLWSRYKCTLYDPNLVYCFLHPCKPQVTKKSGSYACTYPMCRITSGSVLPANDVHKKHTIRELAAIAQFSSTFGRITSIIDYLRAPPTGCYILTRRARRGLMHVDQSDSIRANFTH